jgi:uroporphyrinogen-III synthase
VLILKRLLYTGIARNLKEKADFFLSYGYYMIDLPLIEIESLSFDLSVDSKSDWLFLTSQAPLEILPYDYLQSKRIAVIGQQTANALAQHGLKEALIAEEPTRESLLQTFSDNIQKAFIFYPKSDLADNYLETELLKKGYQITSKVIYRNQLPKYSEKSLIPLIYYKDIRTIFFSSPSTWVRFRAITEKRGVDLNQFDFLAQGETTKLKIIADGYPAKEMSELEKGGRT